ncbi:MAG: hypothetical protein QM705_15200 [Ancrocorticia sp.]
MEHTTHEEGDIHYLLNHITAPLSEHARHRITEAYAVHGTPFAAYLLLEDTNPEDPAIAETFTDVYATTWDTIDQLLDNELDALGWNDALNEFRAGQGIQPELLTWNRPLFTAYINEVYSIIELYGQHHVFYR